MRRRGAEPVQIEQVGQADSVTGITDKNMPDSQSGM